MMNFLMMMQKSARTGLLFTVRLHVMRHSIVKATLSICLSVKCMDCDKTKKNLCPHSYTT